MFDGSLMLQMNLPVANSVHSKGNRFVTGVMIKVTGDLTFNDSTDSFQYQVSLYGNGVMAGAWLTNLINCEGILSYIP